MDKLIWEFKDINEAKECFKEWKEILELGYWIIKIQIVPPEDMQLEGSGESEYQITNKCAIIRLLEPHHYGDRIVKQCHEETLVHELLHCKFGIVDMETEKSISCHLLIEEMARALIKAKYGTPLEEFDNITYEEDNHE